MKKTKRKLTDGEVFITNLDNPKANAYRNMRRYLVDKFFYKSEKAKKRANNIKDKIERSNLLRDSFAYNKKARAIWRNIITKSNKIK